MSKRKINETSSSTRKKSSLMFKKEWLSEIIEINPILKTQRKGKEW
jgi:hypothetical protein